MEHEREPQTPEESPKDLTPMLETARRGFRRDTEPLTSQLDTALVYVAMAEPVQDDDDDDDLRIVPQLTQTDGGQVLFPVFTSAERLRQFATRLGWSTEGDELSYCSLSLRSGFDVLIDLAAEDHVEAMVIDPAEEHELLLRPNEVAELRQGHAIPLVGYVSALPPDQSEPTLVSELDEPPNEALLAALAQCLEQFPAVLGYRLEQTFNRERDLEPHPTLTLRTNDASEEDLQALRAELQEIFEIPLTAPGYIDVVFEDAEPGP